MTSVSSTHPVYGLEDTLTSGKSQRDGSSLPHDCSSDGSNDHLAVEDSLTDRQLEVLQTAYNSGYFQSPRASTGEAIADSLGISQPTFAAHLRAAHRKLLPQLFEGPPTT